ncbi:hypothetical protein K504DRAFT_491370 [Pleomassaria siparia CBS 279.74]|uniref:Uncharacterized protein n=1 Tax=Pleomassaria siparia CBS 279.74 TaxID=1314801 RepID=A0A6G1K7U2_9PLEO|nr:hypothetical protein K504DRAFT_491370 [Pleomassaria siparia CBS 279.74]
MDDDTPPPVAIIGSACRFPGRAACPSELWKLLQNPRDLLQTVPSNRFHWEGFHRPDGQNGGRRTKEGYFLDENIRAFDPEFFHILPTEAETIDPQHRILLENVYEAMESAGLTLEELRGTDTGVYVGMMDRAYYENACLDVDACGGHILSTGTSRAMAANRVSYTFDFRGPSMTIDTACSSSMMAVHLAVSSLRQKESTIAFACGAQLHLNPTSFKGLTKMNMISPDGRSKMFDESADGYGRGEGVGVVCLKLLDEALKDGDHIECIIRETGTNQDGHTKGITLPSANAQAELIRKTYKSAGLDPTDPATRPHFFEAHGTGTLVGDPLEAQAIEQAFFPPDKEYADDDVVYVGSIKSIIGHLEGTAGLAGLLRASLAVQYGIMPPNLLFNRMNLKVAPYTKHIRLVTATQPWPAIPQRCPRRASVNSFGFGGSNTHVIIESYENPRLQVAGVQSHGTALLPPITPFTLSALSETSLLSTMEVYVQYLEDQKGELSLRDLAWTLQYRRSQFSYSYAVAANTRDELVDKLKYAVKVHKEKPGTFIRRLESAQARIMGIFTGQGSQWATMGKELIECSSYAREILEKLDASLASLPEPDRPSWKLVEEIMIAGKKSRVDEAVVSQPLTTAIHILMVDLMRIAGVKLDAVIGHSSGEIGATYAAGLVRAEDAIRIAYYRGLHSHLVVGNDGQRGAMAAAFMTAAQAKDLCGSPEFQNRIVPAAYNSPSIVTLSGDEDAIDEACEKLSTKNIITRKLKVDRAYHSHHMRACAGPYLQYLEQCNLLPGVPSDGSPIWFSSVNPGDRNIPQTGLPASYWVDNMTNPVQFSQAVSEAISERGTPELFIEFGPHPSLETPVRQIAPDQNFHYIGLLRRGFNAITSVSEALGIIWGKFGKNAIDLASFDKIMLNGPEPKFLKDLPTYSWDHSKDYWWESRLLRKHYGAKVPPTELLGAEVSMSASHEMKWRQFLNPSHSSWMLDHKLNGTAVLPGAAYIAMATTAAQRVCSEQSLKMIEILDLRFKLSITFPDERTAIETVLTVFNITRTTDSVKADFFIDFCIQQKTDELMTAARGRFNVQLGVDNDDTHSYILPELLQSDLNEVNPDVFYEWASRAGYGYTGPFQCITSLKRRRDFSIGELAFTPSETLFHPAVLDGLFQACIVADAFPGDSAMPKFNVPSYVRSVKIFPSRWEEISLSSQSLNFNIAVTGISEFGGVLYSTTSQGIAIQMQGFTTAPFQLTTVKDDVSMYAEVVWTPCNPGSLLLEESVVANLEQQRELATACERVALFYLRQLNDIVSYGLDSSRADQAMQYLMRFARLVLTEVRLGLQPSYLRTDWLDDTQADIAALVKHHSASIDLQLLDKIGKAYPLIIYSDMQALATLLEDDALNRLYRVGIGFPETISQLGSFFRALSRRSPNMRILEVGAGTGSVTGTILEASSCSAYTFTDVSPGFLGPAKEMFKRYANKMSFQVFDMEKDTSQQGLHDRSFEVIVAANVLHASADVEGVLSRIRPLLRPGGYLVCMDLSATKQLKNTVIMGGLIGWWLRNSNLKSWSPALTESEWDTSLRRTGFSGVDAITPTSKEMLCPYRVFCSQAVDDRVFALREPLSPRPRQNEHSLLIIDSSSIDHTSLVDSITDQLLPFFQRISVLHKWEDIGDSFHIPYAVLSMVELDEPMFREMSATKWTALQKIFGEATDVLWVTSEARSPKALGSAYANMTIGLARSVRHELGHLRLGMLDFDELNSVTAVSLSKAMLRWYMLGQWALEGVLDDYVFGQEQEMAIDNGAILVPSIVHATKQTARYNSGHRNIVREVDPHTQSVELYYETHGKQFILRDLPIPHTIEKDRATIKMLHSTFYAMKFKDLGYFHLGLGVQNNVTQVIVILSESVSSIVHVPDNAIYRFTPSIRSGKHYLHAVAANLIADRILDTARSGGNLLVLAADPLLMSLLQAKAAQKKKVVIFITGDPEFEQGRAVYVHPHSLDITVQKRIPPGTSVFFNLSTRREDEELFQRIAVMYRDSDIKIKSVNTMFRKWSSGSGRLQVSRIKKMRQHIQEILALSSSLVYDAVEVHTMSPKDVIKPDQNPSSLAIVDWTSDTRLPVTVQPATQVVTFSPAKTYLVIGSSDVAQSICEWLVEHGAKYVVIGSRTPSAKITSWAQTFASKGALVNVRTVDVTSASSVSDMLASVKSGLGFDSTPMPPIGGLFHLGLVLKDALFSKMRFEDLQAVTDVKAKGSHNLHYELLNEKLDFFVMTSSISYLFGNPGQCNYAAANAFMVGLAHYRRNIGLPASVVDLGRVEGIGYMTRQVSDKQTGVYSTDLQNQMLYPISERDIHEIFAEAVLASPADSGISPEIITGVRDIDPALVPHIPWGTNPRFANLINEGSHCTDKSCKPRRSVREELREEIAAAEVSSSSSSSAPSAQDKVFNIIRTNLVKHLSVLLQFEGIDDKRNLLDMGMDSLVASDIQSWAKKELSVDVPHAVIFGDVNVVDIASFITSHLDTRWVCVQQQKKLVAWCVDGTLLVAVAIVVVVTDHRSSQTHFIE